MVLNALFNKDRVNAVRKAVECDKPLPGIKHAELLEEPAFQGESNRGDVPGRIPGGLGNILLCMSDPPTFNVGRGTYGPTDLLLLAIEHDDLHAARLALATGADYSSKCDSLPPDPSDSDWPDFALRAPLEKKSTPIDWARDNGRAEIVKLIEEKMSEDKSRGRV